MQIVFDARLPMFLMLKPSSYINFYISEFRLIYNITAQQLLHYYLLGFVFSFTDYMSLEFQKEKCFHTRHWDVKSTYSGNRLYFLMFYPMHFEGCFKIHRSLLLYNSAVGVITVKSIQAPIQQTINYPLLNATYYCSY